MTVLSAVFQPLVQAVFEAWRHLPFCCAIRPKFIGHNPFGQAITLDQFSQQPLRRRSVPSALQDFIQNDALLIDRAPEPE